MPKKILFVITKSVWGGAQRYVYDLATHLPSDKFKPIVALGGKGPLAEKLNQARVETISLPVLQLSNKLLSVFFSFVNISTFIKLIIIFRKERPDIIHLNSSKIGGIGAIAAHIAKLTTSKYTPKLVFTVHGWAFNEDRILAAKWLIYLIQWLTALFCHQVIIISNHDYEQALLMPFFKKDKFVLIPLGIPTDSLNFLTKKDARKYLSHYTLSAKRCTLVGIVAELTKNKGLTYLIDAAKNESAELQTENLKFVIIGEGEDKDRLQRKINSLGLQDRVYLTGFIPEAAKYFKAFDIFVLPSLKEGLPYTLLEAMHAGLPIVATSVGGNRDIGLTQDFADKEKRGLLVAPKNPDAIRNIIKKLCSDKSFKKYAIKESVKKSKTKFSFDNMLTKSIILYEQSLR